MSDVSEWVRKHMPLIPAGGQVLDLACGGGRHTALLLSGGYGVTAVDIDVHAVGALSHKALTIVEADLEAGGWPFGPERFDGIVVTNYLWRPLFEDIRGSLKQGGVVIYETFAVGNEAFGRPRNPDFLLREGELKDMFSGFEILDYRHGPVGQPKPAVTQGIAARKR
ncbi:class I SAM-dependent methyltransferase [Sneathiella chinensis]|uniref:SAM-dependent methyltransferase n=1 Tax=Sneathiella chinensis TaxID=349750 RepID=A0ABQ5U9E1_9PROT|nr:class I SAM-dependent methyltransferase [Sneathiella chinensis]GLQ08046.1 SAM-dependent methyltransferase [Sneathiella chinensis]